MKSKINHKIILVSRPTTTINESNFKLVEEPLSELGPSQVLVRTLYISLDPTHRIWMSDIPQYMPPIEIGECVRSGGIGVVEQSQHEKFAVGDTVFGLLGWQEYALVAGDGLRKLPPDNRFPMTASLSVLGLTGCTAYFGLLDVGKPKQGETVVVSAAAGAVGSIVGQIGKIKGCRVVGIAGSNEKCRWIKDELGFDAAINYKTDHLETALLAACPDGVDVYFDNVGGGVSAAVIDRMNLHGRIALCGLISGYNSDDPMAAIPKNFSQILMKRLMVKGFIIMDYDSRWQEAVDDLGKWLHQGKIKYAEDIVDGLLAAPVALKTLFDGKNKGKLIVKI